MVEKCFQDHCLRPWRFYIFHFQIWSTISQPRDQKSEESIWNRRKVNLFENRRQLLFSVLAFRHDDDMLFPKDFLMDKENCWHGQVTQCLSCQLIYGIGDTVLYFARKRHRCPQQLQHLHWMDWNLPISYSRANPNLTDCRESSPHVTDSFGIKHNALSAKTKSCCWRIWH